MISHKKEIEHAKSILKKAHQEMQKIIACKKR